jgi:phospholipid/cholesterol/gamma-HCH transport system substrate-binding protein
MPVTPYTSIARRGGAGRRGLTPFVAGLVTILVVALGAYWAYTKINPFSDPYELNAIFENVNELRVRSPVRIAGVDVGKVVEVESLEDGSGMVRVKMEIKENGLPIKEDAELTSRSRLFLEGNYFLDLHPGTPSAKELESGSTLGPDQTAIPVQQQQVLTALQRDTREDLKTFLREYSSALAGKGGRGGRGFNEAIRHWEDAYRDTSQVNDANLGLREHDLSRLMNAQGRVFGAFVRDERALKDFITHFNTTAAAFAREEENLSALIPQLRDVLKVGRPALRSLNSGLPSVRAFARDALPGVRSSSPTLDEQIPFIRQSRALMSEAELKGLTRDLAPTVPRLARLNRASLLTLEQQRALSACQNNVLLPFSKTPIPDPDFPQNSGEPFFEQSPRTLVGLSGESRIADANTPFFRVQSGGGPVTLVYAGETGERSFAQALFPIEGTRPAAPTQRPVFRPDVPCELQEPPDMNAVRGGGDEQVNPTPDPTPLNRRAERRVESHLDAVIGHLRRVARGQPSVDPLEFNARGELMQWRRLGIKPPNWAGRR